MNRKLARGAALLALCCLAWVPMPALGADDPWPEIRSDYREGRFASAIARLERLVAADPNDREAYYYLALINWRTNNLPAAAAAYKRVLALDPTGPFGDDARHWLATYANGPLPTPTPTPLALPTGPVTPEPTGTPWPVESRKPHVLATSKAPWLQVEPKETTNRPRGMNARPGYFKVADGTFEFIPPKGFVLLNEGVDGSEWHALFGPGYTRGMAQAAEQPPTLLLVWRELPELKRFHADQRAARERQLLAIEASTYGPGAKVEARYGVPVYRVDQKHGDWAARTLLFFKYGRLYALTYGGDAHLLPRFQAAVEHSWTTPIFYP